MQVIRVLGLLPSCAYLGKIGKVIFSYFMVYQAFGSADVCMRSYEMRGIFG